MQNPENTIDRFAVAARLRALLFARDPLANPSDLAESLGVRESILGASIDATSPYPWVEVLLAVVRRYGVDPTWILTGAYDPATHREALEDEANAERLLSRTTLPRERRSRRTALAALPHRGGESRETRRP